MNKYERFIAVSGDGLYGHFGYGNSKTAAKRQLRQAGGRIKKCRVYRFSAMIPFAPVACSAIDTEADCWMSQDGSIKWLRCEREIIT